MPTYSITGPDGKTYSLEGPEGATRKQIIGEINRQYENKNTKLLTYLQKKYKKTLLKSKKELMKS